MTLGEVFLESISTGVITIQEMAWVGAHQDDFSRAEVATAIRLGRLIDEGQEISAAASPDQVLFCVWQPQPDFSLASMASAERDR